MKFHDPRQCSHKNAPHTGGHVFSPIRTIFELVRDIYKTKVLTNFHDDWAKIVTSRPNRENCHYIHIEKNAPHTGGHVFSPIWTIFELVRDIYKTKVLTNFHDDWAKIVTSRVEKCHAHWRPCFFTDLDHFELVRVINKTNVLTNFYDDWAKIVTSRPNRENCHYIHIEKNATPTGGHVFSPIWTIFELN
ncbi:hypothetical protein DPMN_100602 [Dreissena polymorpha]|uniref:Uncharacterized protein n=1 Tax=Dreissena polymorpha TaxID=45954 RepID=A0A9D4R8C8_DREPO|nr:hypothetical protein DPMN_100602 [Dreissena polymorpha]